MKPNDAYRTETYSFGFNDFKTTPLGLLALEGHETEVRAALAAGIDWAKEHDCVLEGVLMNHNTALALELIAAGSPVTTAVLSTADYTNNTAMVGHILKHDPIIGMDHESMEGYFKSIITSYHLFKEDIHVLLLSYCLAHGVDPNLRITGYGDETENWPALNVVAYRKRLSLITLLVEAGADINSLNPAGESPRYCCAKSRDYKGQLSSRAVCLDYLQSHGATYIPTLTLSQKIQMYFQKHIYKPEPPKRVF